MKKLFLISVLLLFINKYSYCQDWKSIYNITVLKQGDTNCEHFWVNEIIPKYKFISVCCVIHDERGSLILG